mmetsp:Transcript_54140/g.125959  ORF Transcript_54140/g.125959 Transcript_54140/m.125959 type:complete len:385 (-) Transcript_54140:113-1267(-)|eukprot:CAMPEP_0171073144 /NCGR_PEP_ID=MMETSP0766_2-20121228/11318_1 /TAXON_ID=439317 /ORGANISM="Gambierdiscus australes, Strain CAWD 149" /LENGTH=384 /DNA_ID=CAMNT_0011529807 /DNA_START=84 /DNA_END=1238 /DNA_ORIENTATION=+
MGPVVAFGTLCLSYTAAHTLPERVGLAEVHTATADLDALLSLEANPETAPLSSVPDPPWKGWVAVAIALVCFGSFGVPIKHKAVQDAKVHPLVFQTYKTFWALSTAWFALIWADFHFSPWGLLSGVFWVPAGIAAIVAVNNVGLAIGQASWQVTIVIVSFLWGCVGFHEPIKHPKQAIVAVVLLVSGLLGMTFVASSGSLQKQEATEKDALLQGAKDEKPGSRVGLTPAQRFGIGAAIFNGCWGGSNLVPMKFAHLAGPKYVISFAIGSAIVNVALWVFYVVHLWLQEPREPLWLRLPSLHMDVMKVSGTLSGVLWSIGNFASMVAVKELGQAIGYSCVQASIFVSGLWGIFLYGEIRGRAIALWLCSALVALAGVILLARQKG